jgi:5'-3' exonuclease
MVKGYLVSPDGKSVNSRFLTEFLAEIAFIEDDLLQQLTEKRYKDIKNFNSKLRSLPPMQAEIDRFRYIEDKYDDQVRGGTAGWTNRYYLHYHKLQHRHPKDFNKYVDKICAEYLNGTLWVLNYYQGNKTSWNWLYPYFAAPTATDLAQYQPRAENMSVPDAEDEPVSPFVQLMSVLPPDSSSLLPRCLSYYMTSRNSPVHYMYPVNITLQLLGHKWYHECKAQLPHINREILASLVKQHESDFTDEEKRRNGLQNEVVEWNP